MSGTVLAQSLDGTNMLRLHFNWVNGNGDGTLLVCNEESKLMGMDGNRRLNGDVIAGPFFVVGTDGENFRSLTDAEVERYKQRFAEVEDIFPEEVQEHMGFTFFAW